MKIKRTKISTACKTSGGNAADQIMQVQSRKEKKIKKNGRVGLLGEDGNRIMPLINMIITTSIVNFLASLWFFVYFFECRLSNFSIIVLIHTVVFIMWELMQTMQNSRIMYSFLPRNMLDARAKEEITREIELPNNIIKIPPKLCCVFLLTKNLMIVKN